MKRGVLTNARRRRSFFINRLHEVTAHPTFSAEQLMKTAICLFSIGVLLAAAPVGATEDRKNLQVFNDVAAAVNHYAYFSIYDDVRADVKDGVVTLAGKVTMPFKSEEI